MATITTTTSLSFDAAASLTVGVDKNFEGSIEFTSANDDVWPSFTVTKPQSKTYGPFGIAMTVVITVGNGSLDYTINGGMGGFGYDTDGNVTSLVSGDGTFDTNPYGMVCALLGDSIVANNMADDSAQRRNVSRGFFTAANIILGHRLYMPSPSYVQGGSGYTTTTVLDTLLPLVLALDPMPKVAIVHCGINDVNLGVSSATIIANLGTIYARLRARGCIVVATTIMPSSLNAGTIAKKREMYAANAWIKKYAESANGVVFVDTHAVFVDTTTGDHASTYSSDNLHPNTVGAWALGRIVAGVLDPLMPPNANALGSSPLDTRNLIYNPFALGSNAGGSGGYSAGSLTGSFGPNGWEGAVHATGAGVTSKVSRSDGWPGEFARIATTATAGGDGAGWVFRLAQTTTWAATTAYQLGARRVPTAGNGFLYRATTAGTSSGSEPSWPTLLGGTVTDGTVTWTCYDMPAVGDTMEAALEFATSSASGAFMIGAYIECLTAGSSTVFSSADNQQYSGDSMPGWFPATGVLRIPAFTIPATTTQVNLRIRSYAAAGVTANFDVTRLDARLLNR